MASKYSRCAELPSALFFPLSSFCRFYVFFLFSPPVVELYDRGLPTLLLYMSCLFSLSVSFPFFFFSTSAFPPFCFLCVDEVPTVLFFSPPPPFHLRRREPVRYFSDALNPAFARLPPLSFGVWSSRLNPALRMSCRMWLILFLPFSADTASSSLFCFCPPILFSQ